MINIYKANSLEDYMLIEKLADTIWREHYIPITGIGQVEYMLKKYQSSEAIANQIEDGYLYFIINYENVPVGYISIKKENKPCF